MNDGLRTQRRVDRCEALSLQETGVRRPNISRLLMTQHRYSGARVVLGQRTGNSGVCHQHRKKTNRNFDHLAVCGGPQKVLLESSMRITPH